MGFWDVTKNLLAGKPAFEVPDEYQPQALDDDAPTDDFAEERAQKAQEARGLYNEQGVKQIPEAGVTHTTYHVNGTNVEVRVTIRNLSDRPLELDKFVLCGQRRELDFPLQPGGDREFLVYSGPSMTHGHYTEAELYYKDIATGDYFMARHYVRYRLEHNKTYNVQSLELMRPIKDV